MDPPHITEFASERYFSKLNQLNESSTHAEDVQVPDRTLPGPSAVSTTPSFTLPFRASKSAELDADAPRTTEQKRPEKHRFLTFRSKVGLLHSKPTPAPVHEITHDIPRVSVEPVQQTRVPLDQLFLSLPNELQIQIICSLPLTDILNLRLASKSWHTLITLNEAPIVRYHLDNHIPAYALRLYPATDPSTVSFHHLCGLWHRLRVAAKLSSLMCEWITKEIFLRQTEQQRQEFTPQRERMRRRLIPLLFTVFHFFEMYRKLHLQYILDHGGHGLLHDPYTLNPVEAQIMGMYDDQTLLRVHQVFPLVVSSFCRRLRPPSYVGRVERSLRGYLKDKPPDEVHVAILCIGGLRQVERFWEIKGYNTRRGAVDIWYSSLSRDAPPVEPAPSKPKRSLMALGRKKSTFALRESARSGAFDGNQVTQPPTDTVYNPPGTGLVFNTSLAAGMPMGPLGADHVRHLLPDLPSLQQIWTTTAEALILDRKIVERTQDIKRNAQVMLELIREDGMDEEDEWWYGRSSPESVRPLLDVLDGDLLDGVTDEI